MVTLFTFFFENCHTESIICPLVFILIYRNRTSRCRNWCQANEKLDVRSWAFSSLNVLGPHRFGSKCQTPAGSLTWKVRMKSLLSWDFLLCSCLFRHRIWIGRGSGESKFTSATAGSSALFIYSHDLRTPVINKLDLAKKNTKNWETVSVV